MPPSTIACILKTLPCVSESSDPDSSGVTGSGDCRTSPNGTENPPNDSPRLPATTDGRGTHAQNGDFVRGKGRRRSGDSAPTGYRPGRLTSLQILERVFPLQPRSVLELVLQGCSGDVVSAIEQFLSAQDSVVAQHQVALAHAYGRGCGTGGDTSGIGSVLPFSPPLGKMSTGCGNVGEGVKSAFTPLHAAFTARSAAFSVNSLLGGSPSSVYPKPAHNNPSASSYPYPSFPHYVPPFVTGASPMFVTSYPPYGALPVRDDDDEATSGSASPIELVCSSARNKSPTTRE